jgi:hypothetical protein
MKGIKRELRNWLDDNKFTILKLSVFLTILIIIGFAIYYVAGPYYNWYSSYNIKIRNNTKSNYTIIVPVALKNQNDMSDIMNLLTVVHGNASIGFVETKYGKGLKIDGKEDVEIGIEKRGNSHIIEPIDEGYYKVINASMWKKCRANYSNHILEGESWIWTYSNYQSGNISIAIKAEWDSLYNGPNNPLGGGVGRYIEINTIIKHIDWQTANCTLQYLVYV